MEHFKSMTAYFTQKSIEGAVKLQQQMIDFIDATMSSNNKISYQDAANMFFLLKIAEAEAIKTNELICEDIMLHQKNQ